MLSHHFPIERISFMKYIFEKITASDNIELVCMYHYRLRVFTIKQEKVFKSIYRESLAKDICRV